jgi:ribosomal protein L37AE/L43A
MISSYQEDFFDCIEKDYNIKVPRCPTCGHIHNVDRMHSYMFFCHDCNTIFGEQIDTTELTILRK